MPSEDAEISELIKTAPAALNHAGTVASYECCQQVIQESGFIPRLEKLSQSRDRTVAKYAARVLQRLAPS